MGKVLALQAEGPEFGAQEQTVFCFVLLSFKRGLPVWYYDPSPGDTEMGGSRSCWLASLVYLCVLGQ